MRSKRIKEPRARFTAAWEFHVRPEKRRAFEKAYGAGGNWTRLFRTAEGYIGTELVRDDERPGRYVTLDFWTSRLDYLRFKRQYAAAYKTLDKRCKSLTESERLVGEFEKAVSAHLIWQSPNSESQTNSSAHCIRVRPGTTADIPAMIELEREAKTAAHWNEAAYRDIFDARTSQRIALVSENDSGCLQGFIVALVNAYDCELENVVVAQRALRLGIGRELVQALKTEARRRGGVCIFLEVRESNAAARALYESCGFQIMGRRTRYYIEPVEGAVLYASNLVKQQCVQNGFVREGARATDASRGSGL